MNVNTLIAISDILYTYALLKTPPSAPANAFPSGVSC